MADPLVTNDKQAWLALKEHGAKIVWVIVLVLLGYFGYNYWQTHGGRVDTVAADGYTVIAEQADAVSLGAQNPDAVTAPERDKLYASVDSLVANHGDTVYAWQALMTKARVQADNNDLAGAIASLEQANALKLADSGLLAISGLQLAALQLANNELDKALTTIEKEYPNSFEPSRLEILGDIYVAKGDEGKAKDAYNQAWELLTARQEPRALLSLKMQALGLTPAPITPKPAVVKTPSVQPAIDSPLNAETDEPLVEMPTPVNEP